MNVCIWSMRILLFFQCACTYSLHSTDEGIDYEGTSATVTFPTTSTNENIACTNIPILQDNALECSQDFSVAITATSLPAVLNTQSVATVVIMDDDCKCCIVFLLSSAIFDQYSLQLQVWISLWLYTQ